MLLGSSLFCYHIPNEGDVMETKDVIFELRTKKGVSQEELFEEIMVTRQAVSCWENGKVSNYTMPPKQTR